MEALIYQPLQSAAMIAEELIDLHRRPREVAQFTQRYPSLTSAQGYQAALALQPLAAGEIVSTGTLTDAHPVSPGEAWSTEFDGLPLPGLKVRFV